MHPQPPTVEYQTAAPPPPGVHMPAFQVHPQEFSTMNGMEMIVGQHQIMTGQQYPAYQGIPSSMSSTQPQYVSGAGPYSTQQPQYVTTSTAAASHPPPMAPGAGAGGQQYPQYTQPSHQTSAGNQGYPPAGGQAFAADTSMNMVPMPLPLQPVVALPQAPYQMQPDVMSPPRVSSAASASAAAAATTTSAIAAVEQQVLPPQANGVVQTNQGLMQLDELKLKLRTQLEYYFSPENLAHDQYLLTQMDQDQFVPIWTIASFNLVKKLTNDIALVTQVLRESPNVVVDDEGLKVKPNHTRCTVILREIPDDTEKHEVEELFNHSSCPKIQYCEFALNGTWYVTFESEEDAMEAFKFLNEVAKHFKGNPIFARIKKKPMIRVNSGPPPTPTGTVGSTTPTAPGAPSPVAVNQVANNAPSKNGYVVPGAPQQITPGSQQSVPGIVSSVANIMSPMPASSQTYPFVPGQQPNSLPAMQQAAPNSGQIYYTPLPYFPAPNGLMQTAAPWGYHNGFNQGFGAPNMIPDNPAIFSGPYKSPGVRGGYSHKPHRGRRGGGMTADRSGNNDQRDMRYQNQQQNPSSFHQMTGGYQPSSGANAAHYGGTNAAASSGYNSYRGSGGGNRSWDSKKTYHTNNSNYQIPQASAVGGGGSGSGGPPIASITASPPVSFKGNNPPLVSAAVQVAVAATPAVATVAQSSATVAMHSDISKDDSKSPNSSQGKAAAVTAQPVSSAPPVVSVAPVSLAAATEVEAPIVMQQSHSRHHSSSSTTGGGAAQSSGQSQTKGLPLSRAPNNEDMGHGFYQHHPKSAMDNKDGPMRRGRGRGGPRGGRMISDDGRDIGPGGGRGGYSSRGGYQGYRGGHIGRDGGGGTHGGPEGPPGIQAGPKITAPPPPEFEMKGNDFPALPGAGETPTARKISESGTETTGAAGNSGNSGSSGGSGGSTAWGESNRFLDVVKGTARMKIKTDDGQEVDEPHNTADSEPTKPEFDAAASDSRDQPPPSSSAAVSAQLSNSSQVASGAGADTDILQAATKSSSSHHPDSKTHPSSTNVIPTASSKSSSQNQLSKSGGDQHCDATVNGDIKRGTSPVISVSASDGKQPAIDGKSARTYAQIAQKEAADRAAAAALGSASTSPASSSAAVTPSSEYPAPAEAAAASNPKKIVKDQAVKSFQGVPNGGQDTTDQKPSVISSTSTTTVAAASPAAVSSGPSKSGGAVASTAVVPQASEKRKSPAGGPSPAATSKAAPRPTGGGGGGKGGASGRPAVTGAVQSATSATNSVK